MDHKMFLDVSHLCTIHDTLAHGNTQLHTQNYCTILCCVIIRRTNNSILIVSAHTKLCYDTSTRDLVNRRVRREGCGTLWAQNFGGETCRKEATWGTCVQIWGHYNLSVRNSMVGCWLRSGCCEHGNELSGSMKRSWGTDSFSRRTFLYENSY